jgi:hypothetical protein
MLDGVKTQMPQEAWWRKVIKKTFQRVVAL